MSMPLLPRENYDASWGGLEWDGMKWDVFSPTPGGANRFVCESHIVSLFRCLKRLRSGLSEPGAVVLLVRLELTYHA